jgi:ribonuclease P protein component
VGARRAQFLPFLVPSSLPPSPPPLPLSPDPSTLTFRARHRLTHAREFDAVYDAKARKSRGPLLVFTRPNDLPHHRLGLAVSSRLGGAVVRNRLKRLIREAFRLEQHELPFVPPVEDSGTAAATGFDIIVSVRSGKPLPLAAYRRLLRELVEEGATEWRRRARRVETSGSEDATHSSNITPPPGPPA